MVPLWLNNDPDFVAEITSRFSLDGLMSPVVSVPSYFCQPPEIFDTVACAAVSVMPPSCQVKFWDVTVVWFVLSTWTRLTVRGPLKFFAFAKNEA